MIVVLSLPTHPTNHTHTHTHHSTIQKLVYNVLFISCPVSGLPVFDKAKSHIQLLLQSSEGAYGE